MKEIISLKIDNECGHFGKSGTNMVLAAGKKEKIIINKNVVQNSRKRNAHECVRYELHDK